MSFKPPRQANLWFASQKGNVLTTQKWNCKFSKACSVDCRWSSFYSTLLYCFFLRRNVHGSFIIVRWSFIFAEVSRLLKTTLCFRYFVLAWIRSPQWRVIAHLTNLGVYRYAWYRRMRGVSTFEASLVTRTSRLLVHRERNVLYLLSRNVPCIVSHLQHYVHHTVGVQFIDPLGGTMRAIRDSRSNSISTVGDDDQQEMVVILRPRNSKALRRLCVMCVLIEMLPCCQQLPLVVVKCCKYCFHLVSGNSYNCASSCQVFCVAAHCSSRADMIFNWPQFQPLYFVCRYRYVCIPRHMDFEHVYWLSGETERSLAGH